MTAKHLLSEIVAGLDGVSEEYAPPFVPDLADAYYNDAIAQKDARIDQLEKALEPFAAEANQFAETWPDGARERPDKFNLGDLRRARAALGGSNE